MVLHERFFALAVSEIFFRYPKIANDIIKSVGSFEGIFRGDREHLRELFGDKEELWNDFIKFNNWGVIEKKSKTLDETGVKIITLRDSAYPYLLSQIYDPPPVIMFRGVDDRVLGGPCIAIVGARKAGEHSLSLAAAIAEDLSDTGIIVVSGLAYGIDAAAHRGALQGVGDTIAVLGCGPDVMYPSKHRDLSERIVKRGAVITEFPVGMWPDKPNFPQRNRIISGLSLGTVIVEAAEKSGSLITARFALEQGREVMAVPGRGGTPYSKGNNSLIRDGASLVETGEDVLKIIRSSLPAMVFPEKSGHLNADIDMDTKLIEGLNGRDEYSVDWFVEKSGEMTSKVLNSITRLVLAGMLIETPGRKYRLPRQKGNS